MTTAPAMHPLEQIAVAAWVADSSKPYRRSKVTPAQRALCADAVVRFR